MPGGGYGIDMDENIPRRLRSEGSAKDIFALVKTSMASPTLSQKPLLVYPQSFLPATERFFRTINSCNLFLTASLDESRSTELNELAKYIELDFPHLRRGVAYLRSLSDENRRRLPSPHLRFIEAGPTAAHSFGDVRLGARRAAPTPYKLQVVFHHHPAE